MKKIILGLIGLVIVASACKVMSTNLPEKPKQLEIKWTVDGGMLDRSEHIYISNDSCAYNLKVEGRLQFINFSLSQTLLDSLYKTFYNTNFDKIETNEMEVYDRGGTSIRIEVDGDDYEVSNAGMSYVDEKYKPNYLKVESLLKAMAFDEMSKQKRLIDIKLDSSITNSKHNVILYVNGESYYHEKKDGEYLTLDLSLFSMNNEFEIYFMQKTANQTYETVVERFEVVLEELPVKNEILLILEDKVLKVN